jgi:hypothetical protein
MLVNCSLNYQFLATVFRHFRSQTALFFQGGMSVTQTSYRLTYSSLALAFATIGIVGQNSFDVEALAMAGGILTVFAALTAPLFDTSSQIRILHPSAARGTRDELPKPHMMRHFLARALQVPPPPKGVPHTLDESLARILAGGLPGGPASVETIDEMRLTELFLLLRVMKTTPGDAGRLAQFFWNASAVLELRDGILRDDELRQAWEEEIRSYGGDKILAPTVQPDELERAFSKLSEFDLTLSARKS